MDPAIIRLGVRKVTAGKGSKKQYAYAMLTIPKELEAEGWVPGRKVLVRANQLGDVVLTLLPD